MMNRNPNSILSILSVFLILIYSSCRDECTPKETIVDNKLTPEVLSFFRYDSLDTITCRIENQPEIVIQSYEKEEGINKFIDYSESRCGTDVVYNNHYRIVNYFDNTNKLILRTDLNLTNQNFMMINFDFYNTTINENYIIGMFSYAIPDTATIDGQFFSDLYTKYEPSRNYHLYYSKSSGLVKIISNDKTIFQLIK